MYDRISDHSRRRVAVEMEQRKERQTDDAVRQIIEFDKTPTQLKEHMDRFIIGQEPGKKIIATAIAFHYRRLGNALKHSLKDHDGDVDEALRRTRTPKANILMVGPTGCGKTYTGETVSELVGVPFIVEDLTKYSEVGYVGQNPADILADLLITAGGNAQVAQMAIIYLDEIDKIANEPAAFKDVSGKGVQKGLLKLVEGVENIIGQGNEKTSLSTKHVLFLAGGAYDRLDAIVEQRMSRQGLEGDWRDHLLTEDLVSFGMERQLMGRFPVRVVYDRLSTEDLKDILVKSADSPLTAYINDLKAWDIHLTASADALTAVARRAEQEGTGARGLTGILHRILLGDMFRLPGHYRGELLLDAEYVKERLR